MKGLLIKDLIYVSKQKYLFLFIFAFILLQLSSSGEGAFIVGYFTFMCSTMSTIGFNYDQADNGYPFMFSLPITRKDYVLEKYLLSSIFTIGAWFFSNALIIVFNVISKKGNFELESFLYTLPILVMVVLVSNFMIPLQIKYDSEKARSFFFAMIGIIMAVFIVFSGAIKNPQRILETLSGLFNNMSSLTLSLIVIGISLIISILSYSISIKIINNKEF